MLVLRERNRRRSAQLDASGRPTLALLSAGVAAPARPTRDLSTARLPALALTLLRRPPAQAAGGGRLRRGLARLAGVELVAGR
jgi:hypothetical protein